MSFEYPRCDTCLADGVLDDGKSCPVCQGYGDLRVNVLPDISDLDYEMLQDAELWAIQEVFNVS